MSLSSGCVSESPCSFSIGLGVAMHCRSINKSLQCDPIKILKVGTVPSYGMMAGWYARAHIVRILCHPLCRYTFGLAGWPDVLTAPCGSTYKPASQSPRTVAEGW